MAPLAFTAGSAADTFLIPLKVNPLTRTLGEVIRTGTWWPPVPVLSLMIVTPIPAPKRVIARSIVTDQWKYIAVRFPLEVRDKLRERGHHLEQAGWDGRVWRNPDGEIAARYGTSHHFPNYADRDQLYDLTDDVYEQRNLAKDPRYAERLDRMRDLLRRELEPLPHSFGEFKAESN